MALMLRSNLGLVFVNRLFLHDASQQVSNASLSLLNLGLAFGALSRVRWSADSRHRIPQEPLSFSGRVTLQSAMAYGTPLVAKVPPMSAMTAELH
ncbi:hypothetical protein DAEQUDRAFT_726972 [Daedalea quercina L-15889]|uniref:Uncharacterized protein n=1 Tax=Daedalea quercina L-15889 TaxID=1314783 RepID=A0A165Q7F4_9APHY|nr:hypothetical protein DAEQUDRAFT_726972 [Daedalea quercina L-15889]